MVFECKELVLLAKLTPDDPTTVEVFECCINGQEMSPGYTEQNGFLVQSFFCFSTSPRTRATISSRMR